MQELTNGGAVLGVFPDWKYRDSRLQFRDGDRLLLFTDGITEAGLPDGEEFGDRGLIESARKYAGRPTAELKELLLMDVKQFCAFQLKDDATLIVISALADSNHALAEELESSDAVSVWES